jgi:hypothetical protein
MFKQLYHEVKYMGYINIIQTVGGFVFACLFWYMCYKVEQTINNIKG